MEPIITVNQALRNIVEADNRRRSGANLTMEEWDKLIQDARDALSAEG